MDAGHSTSSLLATCHTVKWQLPALEWLTQRADEMDSQEGLSQEARMLIIHCQHASVLHPEAEVTSLGAQGSGRWIEPLSTVIREARL